MEKRHIYQDLNYLVPPRESLRNERSTSIPISLDANSLKIRLYPTRFTERCITSKYNATIVLYVVIRPALL